MGNSPLVIHTKISPNRSSPRNHEIDTISIHCVVGQVTAESLGNWFAQSSAQASSNYGVDKDGRIGMYVEEKDRSWCTSSRANDNRAITIEVASDSFHPYRVTDKAYNALIDLLVDICQRNPKIGKLKWKADKSLIGQITQQNMTVHKWFASKSCPGDYLYNLHYDIVEKVNARLGVKVPEKKDGVYTKGISTKLSKNFQSTEFDCHGDKCCNETLIDAKLVDLLQTIRDHFGKPVTITSGYRCSTHNSTVSKANNSYHTKGQACDFTVSGVTPREVAKYAESMGIKGIGLYETNKDGHFVHIDTRTTKSFWYGQSEVPMVTFTDTPEEKPGETPKAPESNVSTIQKGCLVSISSDATYYNGKAIPNWVKKQKWVVKSVDKDRAIIDKNESGTNSINSPVNTKYLTVVKSYFSPYMVRVSITNLNMRTGPSTSNPSIGYIPKGAYTIVEESGKWGRLKSKQKYKGKSVDAWIHLDYAKKV